MRPYLAAALLLAVPLLGGCERKPPNSMAEPTPSPTPSPAVGAAPGVTMVTPGELRTSGDWAVGCDNTALCQMASLAPKRGEPPSVTMALLRQPGGHGAIDLSFESIGDGPAVLPIAVAIDDRRLPLEALGGVEAATVADGMANGSTLTVLERGDRARVRLSLAGASAALRWIDAQQGRAGSITAIVAKGPATTVADRRTAPVIPAVVAHGTAAAPSSAQVAEMRRHAACQELAGARVFEPEAHALGRDATLVLLPCAVGAYNLSSALFVVRGQTVEPARTDAPAGFDATPARGIDRLVSVVNGAWTNGELTSDAKGRGLGDCGVRQTFVWDGTRLRLAEQSEMRECRGNPHFITTWRAQVVRG